MIEEGKETNKNGSGCEEHTFFGVEKTPVIYIIEFACFCFGGVIGLMLFNNAWGFIGSGFVLTIIAHFIQYIYRRFKKTRNSPAPKRP